MLDGIIGIHVCGYTAHTNCLLDKFSLIGSEEATHEFFVELACDYVKNTEEYLYSIRAVTAIR